MVSNSLPSLNLRFANLSGKWHRTPSLGSVSLSLLGERCAAKLLHALLSYLTLVLVPWAARSSGPENQLLSSAESSCRRVRSREALESGIDRGPAERICLCRPGATPRSGQKVSDRGTTRAGDNPAHRSAQRI